MSKAKNKQLHHGGQFYGTATIGEKGQIVIPQDARKNLNLKKGDRLLIFDMHDDMLAVVKLSQIEKISTHLSGRLEAIRKITKHKE
ncbi:hypothetical protein A2955_01165 [Candidatus Woesebacteria bacterium RIFCSPLOWO2_01_FULL_37_19]|uniref:SpoVT-AbrB domain-containing protein n=1 Tax=Candidatus Woesebacteria bacterium RIFCSPLOWO2_01_FULL_37_19 TaxID=1802514 RepID=A0A1F8B662_9BACT|nr:MAG: hypothetical protein A2955_01165 [Candidatus Woesebacteria bacterium RIFCSPLOWO2_01_FULL_37_19]